MTDIIQRNFEQMLDNLKDELGSDEDNKNILLRVFREGAMLGLSAAYDSQVHKQLLASFGES